MDVKQAAEALGISSEGVRQRIRRGTLESEKDADGRVYVFLESEEVGDISSERDNDAVVTRLEGEVEFLRRELATRDEEIRRRDAIMMSLSEGLKALNPPPDTSSPEAQGSPQMASKETSDALGPSEEMRRERSWWRRLIEG